jgi:hypothetical protein
VEEVIPSYRKRTGLMSPFRIPNVVRVRVWPGANQTAPEFEWNPRPQQAGKVSETGENMFL